MGKIRAMHYDTDLNIEISHFLGIVQNFPIHFHDYYTIGFINSGEMILKYGDKEYTVPDKHLVLLGPNVKHSCSDKQGKILDFSSLNIGIETMEDAVFEVTGEDIIPYFNEPVQYNQNLLPHLEELHTIISLGEKGFKKEELFLLVVEELIRSHSCLNPISFKEGKEGELNKVLDYIGSNYEKSITLNDISKIAGISKYHFLRSFTKEVGITPYKYLETIRINNAKKFLKSGVSPIDVAYKTGFTDQSHLNNLFKKLTGITPKQYMKMFE